MYRKLVGYMMALALLLLASVVAGLFFFGQFSDAKKSIYENLDLQMDFFEKDVVSHYESLAYMGILLSEDMADVLDRYLKENDMRFSDLENSGEHIYAVEKLMVEPLRQKLFQAGCSGAFVLLDTTVNTSVENAELSRSGLYFQVNEYNAERQNMLLYRGISEIGRESGIMPHRKWRLEYRSDAFPGFDRLAKSAELPLERAYYFTEVFTLPGTSERAMLMEIPVVSANGTIYGLCGFEISAAYFRNIFAQSSKLQRLICLAGTGTPASVSSIDLLSTGIKDGYYFPPSGVLRRIGGRGGLASYADDLMKYVGTARSISISPNNPRFTLIVLMPRDDFDRAIFRNTLQLVLLLLLLLAFAVWCCLLFSRRYLSPIILSLEQMKTDAGHAKASNLQEIDNLFAFLAEKDKAHEKVLQDYENAQREIARLAYSRMKEVDPDNYEQFLAGLGSLTPTEKEIFDLYLEGKGTKDIMEIENIKESTLRYHNRNLYSKLGINSLKQMLRYAALMKHSDAGD